MGGALEYSPISPVRHYPDVDPFQHEQRFLLTREELVAFYSAIRGYASLEFYDRSRPLSYTRTTYFDTDDGTYFRSCETAVARRLRVREYAVTATLYDPPALSGICFLELKQNAGNARSKIRLSAPAAVLTQILLQQGSFDAEAAGMQDLAALRTIQDELIAGGTVKPRLTTWYRRTCMTAEGGRVRITLDENLTFCKPQRLGSPGEIVGPADAVAQGPARVLEIKHYGSTPAWLPTAVAGLNPATNFSKFRMGMAALQQQPVALPELAPQRTLTPATVPRLSVLNGNAP